MSDLVDMVISKYQVKSIVENKLVMIQLSRPSNVFVSSTDVYDKEGIQYTISFQSHIEEKDNDNVQVFFRLNNQIYSQHDDEYIHFASFGLHQHVALISLYISIQKPDIVVKNIEDFIYGEKDLKKISKKRLQ